MCCFKLYVTSYRQLLLVQIEHGQQHRCQRRRELQWCGQSTRRIGIVEAITLGICFAANLDHIETALIPEATEHQHRFFTTMLTSNEKSSKNGGVPTFSSFKNDSSRSADRKSTRLNSSH